MDKLFILIETNLCLIRSYVFNKYYNGNILSQSMEAKIASHPSHFIGRMFDSVRSTENCHLKKKLCFIFLWNYFFELFREYFIVY